MSSGREEGAYDKFLNQIVMAKCALNQELHGVGRVIGVQYQPTVIIQKPNGEKFQWVAKLCELVGPLTPEVVDELCPLRPLWLIDGKEEAGSNQELPQ